MSRSDTERGIDKTRCIPMRNLSKILMWLKHVLPPPPPPGEIYVAGSATSCVQDRLLCGMKLAQNGLTSTPTGHDTDVIGMYMWIVRILTTFVRNEDLQMA